MVLRGGNKVNITTSAIDFRRVELGLSDILDLSKILLGRIPWETALESRRAG